MSDLCEVQLRGPAAIVRMNRPEKLNALSAELIDAIVQALTDLDTQAEVRAVVLAGSGRAFSAGADLTEALAVQNVPDSLRYVGGLRRLTTAVQSLTRPVVAAIDGFCFTGGVELAIACDRRIASAKASFAITSSRIGSVAGLGGTQRLPRLIGISAAKDLLMTGRTIDAAEALALGLVDVIADDPVAEAIAWAGQCAQAAPLSVALAKLAVDVGTEMSLESALQLERLLTSIAFVSQDRVEGMTARLEKRTPNFRGH